MSLKQSKVFIPGSKIIHASPKADPDTTTTSITAVIKEKRLKQEGEVAFLPGEG